MDTDMIEFFKLLYQDDNPTIDLRAIEEPKPADKEKVDISALTRLKLSDIDNFVPVYNTAQKWGVFYTVGRAEKKSAKDEDVKKHYALFIDIDNDSLPEYFAAEPSAIISRDSKHHHIYWFLEEPIDDNNDMFRAMQQILIKFYHSDSQIHNPARLMRIPETLNYKESSDGVKYEIQKLEPIYHTVHGMNLAHCDPEKRKEMARRRIRKLFPKKKLKDGDGRHGYMVKACYILNDYDYSGQMLIDELEWINNKYLADKYDAQRIKNISNAKIYAKNVQGKTAAEHNLRQGARISRAQDAVTDWYYVTQLDAMIRTDRPGSIYTKSAFNILNAYATETSNAVGWLSKEGIMNTAESVKYEPNEGTIIEDEQGCKYINMFTPSMLEPVSKEPKWFIEHIKWLFNYEKEAYEHFFSYIAHMVQHPSIHINHAVLIIGKFKGTGKSTINEVLKKIFGEHNCVSPENDALADKYTGWAKNALLCFIHELRQFDKATFSNKIKSFITEKEIQIREMYHPPFTISNHMQIIATSNYSAPIRLEKDDRRWFIMESNVKAKDQKYYDNLYKHVQNDCGQVLDWLQNYDISNFNPNARPPETLSKSDLLEHAKSDLEVYLQHTVEERREPFKNKFIEIGEIQDFLLNELPTKFNNRGITLNRVLMTLTDIGLIRLRKQIKIKDKPRRFMAIPDDESDRTVLLNMIGGEKEEQKKLNKLVQTQYKNIEKEAEQEEIKF